MFKFAAAALVAMTTQETNAINIEQKLKMREQIDAAIDECLRTLPDVLDGNWAGAMNRLHSFNA